MKDSSSQHGDMREFEPGDPTVEGLPWGACREVLVACTECLRARGLEFDTPGEAAWFAKAAESNRARHARNRRGAK